MDPPELPEIPKGNNKEIYGKNTESGCRCQWSCDVGPGNTGGRDAAGAVLHGDVAGRLTKVSGNKNDALGKPNADFVPDCLPQPQK